MWVWWKTERFGKYFEEKVGVAGGPNLRNKKKKGFKKVYKDVSLFNWVNGDA